MNKAIKYKLHNEEDFEYLFKALYAPVCLYGQSIVSDSDAVEDIVADVFHKVWEKRESMNEQDSIKSYIYRAVHNSCLNFIRDTKKFSKEEFKDELSSNDIEKKIEQSETEMRIMHVIKNLPDKCREVFELSRFEELSHKEISEKLEISTKTIENHITKALKILREQLRDIIPIFILILNFIFFFRNK